MTNKTMEAMEVFKLILFLISLALSSDLAQTRRQCEPDFTRKQKEHMDRRQDVAVTPCEDFYTHACGNWRVSHQFKRMGARDTLTTVKAANKLLLTRYFEAKTYEKEEAKKIPLSRQRLLDFHNSCMDLLYNDGNDDDDDDDGDGDGTGDKNASIYIYAKELQRFSDWPILNPYFLDSSANVSFNWEYVSAEIRRYGVNSFWRTLVQPNWQTSEQLIFYVMPPAFDFLRRSKRATRHDNSNDHHMKDDDDDDDDDEAFYYKTYVKYLLLDLGVRVRKALRYADEIVSFEQELMSLAEPSENSVVLKAPQSLASLAAELPNIQVKKFFRFLLQDINLPADYEQRLLIVADIGYLKKLHRLIRRTKAETLGKYLLVQFLTHFEVSLHGEQSFSARQEHCLQQANKFLPLELSSLFLDLQHDGMGNEFLQQAQRDLNEMFNNLKLQFELAINATNVFDQNLQTRTDGLEKLHSMQLKLPQMLLKTDKDKDEEEEGEEENDKDSNGENKNNASSCCHFVVSGNYDENLLNLSKMKALLELRAANNSLGYEYERDSKKMNKNNENEGLAVTNYGPLDVNAYYRLKKNAIEIPVGLLSLPIYDNCLEQSMIYGTIGFIVGHELLHGFDYDGLNYDKSGNIADGWDPKSIIAYGTKASCYLGSRYNHAHTNVNENIADSEGLRLALGALQRKQAEKEATSLTSEQMKLFFTRFAQIWCRESSDFNERHALHAAHRERVNNVLGNFHEFAETFECKPGSVMNPAEKCRIW